MTNPNDPVTPSEFQIDMVDADSPEMCSRKGFIGGLTKREYFAAMAMQGMIAVSQGLGISTTQFAEQACVLAYALISELNKEPKP